MRTTAATSASIRKVGPYGSLGACIRRSPGRHDSFAGRVQFKVFRHPRKVILIRLLFRPDERALSRHFQKRVSAIRYSRGFPRTLHRADTTTSFKNPISDIQNVLPDDIPSESGRDQQGILRSSRSLLDHQLMEKKSPIPSYPEKNKRPRRTENTFSKRQCPRCAGRHLTGASRARHSVRTGVATNHRK